MEKRVFIQLKDICRMPRGAVVKLKDLASILTDADQKEELLNLEIIHIPKDAKQHLVVSILTLMEKIEQYDNTLKLFPIGEPEILLKVQQNKQDSKWFLILKLFIVCVVVFVGSGMALMNFHADVNMREAHRQIYKMITGMSEKKPLILQIPYSLGIGFGMAVFFNHILPKKFSNEPSPMEVEIASYRKNMDNFLLKNEKNTEEN